MELILNVVRGEIYGISEKSYNLLKTRLNELLDNVMWGNNCIHVYLTEPREIESSYYEILDLFDLVSNHVMENQYGLIFFVGTMIDEEGQKNEIVSYVYFGHKKSKWLQWKVPESPEWFNKKNNYKHTEWGRLFKMNE